jgi:putative heme-binding domain-containing protein
LDAAAFALLTAPFVQGGSAESRLQAAAVLPAAKLTRGQYAALAALLPAAGPLELPGLLRAFGRGPTDPALGGLLLEKLCVAPARFGLVGGEVQRLLRRYGPGVEQAAVPLVNELLDQTAAQASRVAALERRAADGDAARGRAAFLAGAGACVSCHRVGDTGTRIGPDLSRIGAIRNPRDLAEAIAFPSATLARGYESFAIRLRDGTTLTGTIPAETAAELVVVTADGAETRLARERVAQVEAVAVSLMPAGLDRGL